MSATTATDATQAALQGEQAAVYGYGDAAGSLRGDELDRARRDLDAHRSRRDRLASLLVDGGATPTPPAAAYDVPDTTSGAQARAALAGIETRLAAVYADLVAASTGATRVLAVDALTECTVRATRWGAEVPVFPGLPERA